MNEPNKLKVLRSIADTLKEMYPHYSVEVSYRNYACPTVVFHHVPNYDTGTEVLRELGCGKRKKSVWSDCPEGRTVIDGESEGMEIRVFCDSLPPTCKMEKVIERIPKSEVIVTDEFVEREVRKVVCSGEL